LAKEKQATQNKYNIQVKEILDDGFQRFTGALQEFLPILCDELNQEPEIGNILSHKSDGKIFTVTRSDKGWTMTVKFDDTLHRAVFACDMPVKFRESVEIKPTTNSTAWWLADKNGSVVGGDGCWVGENAVKALLGIS
jgi:hypothetical protein